METLPRAASFRHWWSLRGGSLLAGAGGALLAALMCGTGTLERLEWLTQDLRFQLRLARTTAARIVIVEFGESTLQSEGSGRPLAYWGAVFASAIRSARRHGAGWIGLDVVQGLDAATETDPALAEANRALALALHEGNVVLSNIRGTGAEPINPALPLLFAHPEQTENVGFIDALPDADGVIRQELVYVRDGQRFAPSFAAVLALRTGGKSPADRAALEALAPPETTSAGAASVRVNFLDEELSGERPFPRISLEDLAGGTLSAKERDWLRGAIVLIGPTYVGSNDEAHRVPGGLCSGVEIHAHALATLLDSRPLRRLPGLEAPLTLLSGLALTAAAVFLRFGAGLALASAIAALWGWAAVLAFRSDMLLPVVGPWLAVALATGAHYGVRSMEEARRQRWLQNLFGRYVSRGILEHLLRSPAHLELGGEEREVSVLFVDIRGFTAYSEGRRPAAVLQDLNAFFEVIVPVVDEHGGLLYKYTGDGLLAVFGAPQALPHHPQAAVDAAIEITRAGRRLGTRVGCAINSGVVVCGNIGVAARSEYTVVGDTVNLAARLEEFNKLLELNTEFASEVLMSEQTYEQLPNPPPARGPFEFQVRGREARVRVYQVRPPDA